MCSHGASCDAGRARRGAGRWADRGRDRVRDRLLHHPRSAGGRTAGPVAHRAGPVADHAPRGPGRGRGRPGGAGGHRVAGRRNRGRARGHRGAADLVPPSRPRPDRQAGSAGSVDPAAGRRAGRQPRPGRRADPQRGHRPAACRRAGRGTGHQPSAPHRHPGGAARVRGRHRRPGRRPDRHRPAAGRRPPRARRARGSHRARLRRRQGRRRPARGGGRTCHLPHHLGVDRGVPARLHRLPRAAPVLLGAVRHPARPGGARRGRGLLRRRPVLAAPAVADHRAPAVPAPRPRPGPGPASTCRLAAGLPVMWLTTAGAAAGAGIVLVIAGLRPAPPRLDAVLARISVPAVLPGGASLQAGLGGWMATHLARPGRLAIPRTDLALLGRSPETFLVHKLAAAAAGLASFALLGLFFAATGTAMPWQIPAAASLAAGAGTSEALEYAARIGSGWPFARIAAALQAARTAHEPPWRHLAALGEEIGVPEVSELAGTAEIAGSEGTKIAATLAAKTESLRGQLLADTRSRANSRTTTMIVPLSLLGLGLVLLMAFP